MRIKNNPKIFYLACGLLAEGDRRYDKHDAEIVALADKICAADVDRSVLQWFNLAKTGQVDENPYWPRGHAMLMAVLFMEENEKYGLNQFSDYLESKNMKDPVGRAEFQEWISRLPVILTYTEGVFRGFWKEYCELMFARTSSWMPEIEASRTPIKEFFGVSVPNLVLAPNLFASPFAADFLNFNEKTITLIAGKPNVEIMLNERLHAEIAKHRDKIIAFAESNGLADFANLKKMKEIGYMQGDDAAYIADVIQECFVRVLSIYLAGGIEGRLKSHVSYGFTGLSTIAKYFEIRRPKAENLGDFVDIVLEGMVQE
ncbi:MAG: hypothetical protein FWC76_08065 [Defluviitaleaceae bacterium]|nr:hypothetical protein [Defluviitaleaceae bacterium]